MLTSKVKETKHLWKRMEMGQDTYRHSAFAWFSLGVTMATYPSSLPYRPTYLPACLPAFSAQTTHPSSRATGSAPERTAAAAIPVWKIPELISSPCFTAERENPNLRPHSVPPADGVNIRSKHSVCDVSKPEGEGSIVTIAKGMLPVD